MVRVISLVVFVAVVFATPLPGTSEESGTTRRSLTRRSKSIIWSENDSLATSTSTDVVPRFLLHFLQHKMKYQKVQKVSTTAGPLPDCICVPYYLCDSNNNIITSGIGVIDVRFRRCTGDFEVCCRLPTNGTTATPRPIPTVTPTAPSSMLPIVTPTMSPTTRPTMPTMMPPTTRPTMPPTMPPTTRPPMPTMMPPTTRPTMPPTMPPTTRPTMPPTMPPTTRPPMPPTMPPTTRPTMPPPTMPPTTRPSAPVITNPPPSPVNCICVQPWQCDANGVIIVSGAGVIDPRQQGLQGLCPNSGQVCCRLPDNSVAFPINPPAIITQSPVVPPGHSQYCVCVKTWQCDGNGFVIISGAGVIDPRLPVGRYGQFGESCGAPDEICCRIPASNQDTSIEFPANAPSPGDTGYWGPVKNPGTAQACICVKTWQCSAGNVISQDGAGIIDPRFGLCSVADEICCRQNGIVHFSGSASVSRETLIVGEVVAPGAGICGIRGTNYNSGSRPTNSGDAYFAEFPWMVALLVRQPGRGDSLFQCGASLLNARAILTAAHCVSGRDSSNLMARVGEWDTRNNNEPIPFQEINVQTIVSHPQFYSGGLYHDVAVLILATPVSYTVNAMPVCLPQQGMVVASGSRCFATGWGRSAFGVEGQYQAVLRYVDLPIVEQTECQARLRTTRLGQYFQLHGSFICAGGEPSKDTCRGDGGGPLVCPASTGQYVQVGIVSWGIGCGASSTPAVYASVSQHRQWIDQQLANYGVL